ncbi:uncharacterized protein LOC108099171 isoform X2 [Drosophila ficusphila]|uniref:uncharacterized protein LOC108099171 isoform X2 n=1 Tax=Drosophila ficusphila TaxID=30025 RepID=UPI001C89597C|nr:uncharacterized protein LOC108099171 isoform X2 [Drosophila ficusphila]
MNLLWSILVLNIVFRAIGVVSAEVTTNSPTESVSVSQSPAESVSVSQSPAESVSVSQSPTESVSVSQSTAESAEVTTKSPTTESAEVTTKSPTTESAEVTTKSPTTETAQVTTKSPKKEEKKDEMDKLNDKINAELEKIVSKHGSDCSGNSEFSAYLVKIREAIKKDKTHIEEKFDLKSDFEAYDRLRITLEQQIDFRIVAIKSMLPFFDPSSSCYQFYLKQKETLTNSKKLTNEQKQQHLVENSNDCPNTDDNDSDYDYIY